VALAVSACAYVTLAMVVWWNVWSTHPTSVTTCGCGDSSLFTWFLGWPAYALAHGLDPLYSSAMLHPTGVNLLANTSEVGLGVVLAPVTWVFGPVATFNVALTLSPALSALAMFVLVRRWVTWAPAAFVAGLLYGFSPFVLVSLTDGHLMLGLAVFPPLMVACLDELLFRQRRRPVVVGVTLGVLVFLQFLVGTEVLTIMVMTGCIGLALVVGWWLRAPSAHRQQMAYAGTGLVVGAVAAGVLLAYPVWFVLDGPAHYSGSVWPSSVLGGGGTRLREYVDAAPSSEALVRLLHQIGGYQGASLSNQYLGIGLVAVLVVGLAIWHRDRRLWLLAAIGAVSVVLSFDRHRSVWVPWRVLSHLPLVQNIIPVRFVTVTYLAAAAMLAIVVDHTHRAVASLHWPARRWAAGASALGVSAVALVPVGSYLSQLVPMTTRPVILPTWFATVAPRLPAHQVLLAFPAPFTIDTVEPKQSAMTWQAVDRMHYAMVGAGGPAARVTPPGVEREGQAVVTEISGSFAVSWITADDVHILRQALAAWGVTAVVLPDQPRLPAYEQVPSVTDTAAVLTAAIGSPPTRQASAWVWHDIAGAPAGTSAAAGRLVGCTSGVPAGGTAAVVRATACVAGRT
jgi:hypothetical protein